MVKTSLRTKAIVWLTAIAAAAACPWFFLTAHKQAYLLGIAEAWFLVLVSYLGLSVALRRSNKLFFSVYVGGVFFRLLGIALTAIFVYRYTSLSPVVVLLTLVLAMVIFSLIEAVFLQKESAELP